jgi:2-hydroxychromene-2-carboxylate isomerase
MASQIDFWFSIGSTYSYLSVMRVEDVARKHSVPVRWRPFDVVAIMTEMENFPFHTKPIKLRYMWRDVERRAASYELPWSAIPPYPIRHMSLVNRIALLGAKEGWCARYTRAAYRRWFNNGQDPTVEPSLSEVLREIGQNPEVIVPRAASAEIKAELASETNAARALGIFGSPTFTVGSEIFWGDDRFEDAIQWYRQSDQKSAV